jgi:hypothetical protein
MMKRKTHIAFSIITLVVLLAGASMMALKISGGLWVALFGGVLWLGVIFTRLGVK